MEYILRRRIKFLRGRQTIKESIYIGGEQIRGEIQRSKGTGRSTILRYIVYSLNIFELCIYQAKSTSILKKNSNIHMVKCFDTHVKWGDCWYSFTIECQHT